MPEKITRTVTATVINFSEAVVEDGTPSFKPYPDEIIADTVDKEKALAYLRKKFGADRAFLITNIQTSTEDGGSENEAVEDGQTSDDSDAAEVPNAVYTQEAPPGTAAVSAYAAIEV